MQEQTRTELKNDLRYFKESIKNTIDTGHQVANRLIDFFLEIRGQGGQLGAEVRQLDSLKTIKQVADYLQVTERSIRDWINSEGFPKRPIGKNGKTLRFDLAEVDEWTKRHRKTIDNPANGIAKLSILKG
jgi:excisionase family DNA binding protein